MSPTGMRALVPVVRDLAMRALVQAQAAGAAAARRDPTAVAPAREDGTIDQQKGAQEIMLGAAA